MVYKIFVVLALLGSAFTAPTFYAPPQQRDTNIIVGSSVSGPRTFDSETPAENTNAQRDGLVSGASEQVFVQSSNSVNAAQQGSPVPQDFQRAAFESRPVSGQINASPSVGSASAGSLDGFGPFGGLGSVSSGSGNLFSGSVGASSGSQNLPSYEEHVFPRSGPVAVTQTITNLVTKTHTLRVPVTSDVWVTSVTMVTVPVTQLSTQRRYVPGVAGTVTSVVRITRTPVSIITRTVEVFPAKTMVSVFTTFATETKSVEFWQPIVHIATNYEVMTVPVLQTQTLLQRVFTTVTVTRSIDVTSTRPIFVPRAGQIAFQPSRTYGY